jgi:septal ring factor EnvC (AmiA/AmiB activator)
MRLRRLLTIGLIAWLTTASMVAGHSVRDLKQQVKQTRVELNMTRRKWHQAQQALQKLEKKLAVSARELAKVNDSIYRNQRKIKAKKRDLADNKRQLAERMAELARSLRGMEQWLNEPAMKWILTSDDPGDWDRLATYHRIIGHSQQQLITELKALQQKIVQDEAALEQLAVQLKHERAKRQQRLVKLKALTADRAKLVAQLRSSVRQKSRQLVRDEAQLRSVLHGLSRSSWRGSGHFSRMRGHLPWPIRGRLQSLFHRAIQGSELKWQGVLFVAPEDRVVRAVAPGRVVYADWMSGYGWLMIIEHDKGYMTLYGRNHYLYKEVGQSVYAGEVIARSGKSGGFSRPALYFSIRHNAEPVNPVVWLASKYRA